MNVQPQQQQVIVASVQMAPTFMNVEQSLATALQLTFEAAVKGASVIVLPELCVGGCTFNSPKEASQVSQPKNGFITEKFLPVARDNNCHVAFGYVELLEGKLYNSAAIVGPKGLEGNFQKHNLYGSDNLWATPSEQKHGRVLTRAGRLGCLICRDIGNNYRSSYYAHNSNEKFYKPGDVDTLAFLTNWAVGPYAYPDSSWVELAENLRSNVIVSNRVGAERHLNFTGGSAVIDRNRKIWTNGSSFTDAAVVGGVIII